MSYFGSSNLNKDRASKILKKNERLVANKFRKVILLDGTHFNFAPERVNKGQHSPENSKLEDYLKKVCCPRPRAYNGIILDILKDNDLTPTMIAGALGLSVRVVERILQGLTMNVDLKVLGLIADLLSVSIGELVDACYLRKIGKPFGQFIQGKGIVQEARTRIDQYMQGKRSFWWDEMKISIYKNKKNKSK